MTRASKWLIATPVLSMTLELSAAARAESAALAANPNSAYCSALAAKHNRYLYETFGAGGLPTSLDGRVASEQCSEDKAKTSISVLEQKLNKIDLPKR